MKYTFICQRLDIEDSCLVTYTIDTDPFLVEVVRVETLEGKSLPISDEEWEHFEVESIFHYSHRRGSYYEFD